MKRLFLPALLVAAAPTPCLAEDAPQAAAAPSSTTAVTPQRLAAAQAVANALFPEGTYARIMDKSMGPLMDQILASVSEMPLKDLAGMGGAGADKLKPLGNGSLKEVMMILDPAYERRMKLSTTIMTSEMSIMMTRFEPSIREGLAQAYARRYDERNLAELNTFFSTPTGAAYAADSMTIFMDPEVMSKMQALIPQMMKEMPAVVQKIVAATAALPKVRSYKDLTPTERDKLAALVGVPKSELDRKPH